MRRRHLSSLYSRRAQRGLAMVELTIATPLLVLLLMGTAEFGRAFHQYTTLSKAARDGVRYLASVASPTNTEAIDITADAMQTTRNLVVYGSPAGGTPVVPGLTTGMVDIAVVGNRVQVSVNYPYAPMFALVFSPEGAIAPPVTLSTTALMRAL